MPQLNPEYFASQVFWLFIAFFAIYLFVSKFFIPRIGSVVDLRASSIETDVAFAEAKVAECKSIELNASKMLSEARARAFSIIEAASNAAEIDIATKITNLEKEIQKKSAKEEEKLSRIKTQIQPQIEEIALGLKQEIVSQLMQNLNSKKAKNN